MMHDCWKPKAVELMSTNNTCWRPLSSVQCETAKICKYLCGIYRANVLLFPQLKKIAKNIKWYHCRMSCVRPQLKNIPICKAMLVYLGHNITNFYFQYSIASIVLLLTHNNFVLGEEHHSPLSCSETGLSPPPHPLHPNSLTNCFF